MFDRQAGQSPVELFHSSDSDLSAAEVEMQEFGQSRRMRETGVSDLRLADVEGREVGQALQMRQPAVGHLRGVEVEGGEVGQVLHKSCRECPTALLAQASGRRSRPPHSERDGDSITGSVSNGWSRWSGSVLSWTRSVVWPTKKVREPATSRL